MMSRYCAVRALLKYGVTKLPISLEQIIEILKSSGWEIIHYDLENEEHIEILEECNAVSAAKEAEAFTYKKDDAQIIFIRAGLSANTRRVLLAHELGHIEMDHFTSDGWLEYHPFGLIDDELEDEANNFALEFLAPICVLDQQQIWSAAAIESATLLDSKRSQMVADEIRRHEAFSAYEKELCSTFEKIKPKASFSLKCVLILFVSALLLGNLFFSNANTQPKSTEQPYHTPEPQQIVEAVKPISDTVTVTKYGERYHLPDCRHIRNSTAATSVSIPDAQTLGYTPCADCRP